MKKHRWYLIILILIVLITYGNSLNNDFLSDDLPEIVNNPNIGNLNYSITHYFPGFIRLALYWLVYELGGLNPLLFRSINIFLHIGSVLLIYTLLNLLITRKVAFIVATIFAVHPAISEAVVWISGGGYPQYTFFFLMSFLLYIISKKKLLYILSLVFYLFAFMSHPQMPVSLFLIFPLYELVFNSSGGLKKNWLKTLPYLLISITFVFISLNAIGERENTLQSVHYQSRGIDNPLILIPTAFSSYFELTFFPKTLTLYHSELNYGQLEFIIRAAVTLIFLGILVFAFKKNKKIFFWLAFFAVALSPTLTPFRLNWIVAERYLYLPILGLLVLVGMGLNYLSQKPKYREITNILIVAILLILAGRTIIRNIDWKNEDNLWIATGKTSPSSPNTHNNLGDVYGRRGDKQAALKEFQIAIQLKPNYGDAYHNLANTYMELDQIDKALENYQDALKYNPNLWQSYQNIAAIYFNQKQLDLALENLQKAILLNPRNLNLRSALGIIYLGQGNKEKAKEIFTQVLQADPQNPLANQGMLEINK